MVISQRKFLVVLLMVVGIILFWQLPLIPFDSTLCVVSMGVMIICFISINCYVRRTPFNGQWLRPSIVYLFAYVVVNFQYILDYYLNIRQSFNFPLTINHCLLLEVVGLLGYTVGYIWKYESDKTSNRAAPNHRTDGTTPVLLLFLQVGLCALYLVSVGVGTMVSGEVYKNGYEDMTANYYELLLFSVNVAIVVNNIVGRTSQSSLWKYILSYHPVVLIVNLLYIILKLMSGDRGYAIYVILLFVFGYIYRTEYKFKLVPTIIGIILFSVFMSIIGITGAVKIFRGLPEVL